MLILIVLPADLHQMHKHNEEAYINPETWQKMATATVTVLREEDTRPPSTHRVSGSYRGFHIDVILYKAYATGPRGRVHPKCHSIPYIVHYFWPEPYWPFRTQPKVVVAPCQPVQLAVSGSANMLFCPVGFCQQVLFRLLCLPEAVFLVTGPHHSKSTNRTSTRLTSNNRYWMSRLGTVWLK